MAEKILLVNPIGKVSKRSRTRKRKTGAIKRRKNPLTGAKTMAKRRTIKRKHSVKRRRNPIATVAANPIKRRRRHKRHNPINMGGIRRRARSSASTAGGIVNHMIMPAAIAASGALVSDVIWSNAPIPASVKTGGMQYLAKAGLAVLMVKGVHALTKNKKQAEAMGIGALTVLMHDMGRNILKKSVPSLRMGEYVGEGGALDFNAPLGFYESAPQGANLVPNYPQALPQGQVHGFDDGMGEFVGEYLQGVDGYDDEDTYNM